MSRSDSVSRAAEGVTSVYVTPDTPLLPAGTSMGTRISHRSPPSSDTRLGARIPIGPHPPLSLDEIRGYRNALVFPDVDGCPTQGDQRPILLAVTLDVAVQLHLPPVAVVARHHCVLRAPVPEAAVHEHRQPGPRERNVRPARQTGEVRPETKPASVQL